MERIGTPFFFKNFENTNPPPSLYKEGSSKYGVHRYVDDVGQNLRECVEVTMCVSV